MNNLRLTKVIFLWDLELSRRHRNISTWSNEIKYIFNTFDLCYFAANIELFPIKETIETLQSKMIVKQMSELKIKCLNMPQLRTYVKFQCFTPSLPFL